MDWTNTFNVNSDKIVYTLMEIFVNGLEVCFPIMTKKYSKQSTNSIKPGWFNNDVIKLKNTVTHLKRYKDWCSHYNINVNKSAEMFKNAQRTY